MIKYKLICKDCENLFDSWFSSSKEYERLIKKNLLNCHYCNSLKIEKTLMSPSVLISKYKNNTVINDKKINKIKKKYLNIKNLLKKTLIMLEKILLMKPDQSIIIIKKFLKEFMVQPPKKILES